MTSLARHVVGGMMEGEHSSFVVLATMKHLNPDDYEDVAIDAAGRRKYEAFLDRNFPDWRRRNPAWYGDGICCEWSLGVDGMERTAMYAVDYVEVFDHEERYDHKQRALVTTYTRQIICDIKGDLTSVAEWSKAGR